MGNKVYSRGVLEKVKELERRTWRAPEGRAHKRNLVRNKSSDRKLGNKAGSETQGQLFHRRDRRLQDSQTRCQRAPSRFQHRDYGIRAQSRKQAGQDLPGQGRAEPRGSSPSCTCSPSPEVPGPALPERTSRRQHCPASCQHTGTNPTCVLQSPQAPNPQAN